jgi:CBS domain-containing protein
MWGGSTLSSSTGQSPATDRAAFVKGLHDAGLDADELALAAAMARGFPVRLIGTFEGLVTCDIDEPLEAVMARPEAQPFDQLPVVDGGLIVGLLRRRTLARNTPATGCVRDAFERLDETMLIAADAGILGFLLGAKQHPCRLILDGERITGLVSKSDLQKLPVRSLLFHIVTHLELAMAAWIRRRFPDDTVWLGVLTKSRRQAVEERYLGLAEARLAVDRLTATMFADKRAVILRTAALPTSRKQAQQDFEAIEALRDAVAHIGDYALSQEAADRTIDTVALARSWIEALRGLEVDPTAPRLRAGGDTRAATCPGRSGAPRDRRLRPRS